MKDAREVMNCIWELSNLLRGQMFARDTTFSVTRLLFLKYVVDNATGAKTVQDMQYCAKAQKMFAMRDLENGMDALVPVIKYIEQSYCIEGILDCALVAYRDELFGMAARQKRGASPAGFKALLDYLGRLDLEETGDSHAIGSALVDGLSYGIRAMARDKYAGETSSDTALSLLAAQLLQVKDGESFCDFSAGIGYSTRIITSGTEADITHIDINPEITSLAAMLYILDGKKHFEILCKDALRTAAPHVRADKIFADPPIGERLDKTDDNPFTDSSATALYRLQYDYLKSGGTAVMTCPSGLLFQGRGALVDLKQQIAAGGGLKAVIALPPMWSSTSIGTNLLVITKRPERDIVFVNAMTCGRDGAGDRRAARRGAESILSEETIKKIADAVNLGQEIPGFSHVAGYEELVRNEFNLVPANYVKLTKEKEEITLEQLDAQLADLYKQLME